MITDNTLELQLRESLKQVEAQKMRTNGSIAAPSVYETLDAARAEAIDCTQRSSPAAPDVYRAICEVATAISHDGVSKGGRNQQQGYSFRGIDDVMNALSAPLANADLCILPRMLARTQEERPAKSGGTLFYVTVQADFDFVSARDGSKHTITMYGEAMDSGDKATNKAMSAAYKYAMLQAFCIPTEGMPDADATTYQPDAKSPGKATASVPAPPTGTQAAADAVAAAKIAAGSASHSAVRPISSPAPWTNRGQMRQAFARIRERVGETVYLDAMARWKNSLQSAPSSPDLQWRDAAKALECYEYLVERAVA